MSTPTPTTPEAVEAAAQTLYRQHRARQGFPPFFGEWDNAGSHQPRFRDDARAILTAAAHASTHPTALRVRVAELAADHRRQATTLRNRKGVGRDAGQDEYEFQRAARTHDGFADELDDLLKPAPPATPNT